MVKINKLPPVFIFLCCLLLWIGSTGAVSIYNYDAYQEEIRGRGIEISREMENYIDTYNELLMNFVSLYESSEFVTQKEMDKFYTSWESEHPLHNHEYNINFYGWYSFKNTLHESFFTPINAQEDAYPKFHSSAPKFEKGHTSHPSLDNNDPQTNIVMHKNIGDAGYVFVSLNRKHIESEISFLVSHQKRYFMYMTWGNEKRKQEKPPVYEHSVQLGEDKVTFSYYPQRPWGIISKENTLGIVTGLIGFMINLLICLYISMVVEKTEKSDKARNRAERKLEEQGRFFENFLENLPGIMFIKDVKDDYSYYMVNKEAELFFGYTREEIIGKKDFDLFKENESKFFRSIDEATMNGRKVIDIPCEVITTPHGEAFVHTRKVPIYDNDGEPQFLIGLTQDITKRKINEIELAQYRENLEKMVDQRTQKLKAATAKAEEANRLKSEFLATMSHEIRSPMSGVLGMAELLLDSPLTSEQKGLAKTILNSGEVLMNIIEDILDFSKIEANKLELDPIAVNMLELVDDVCMLYSSRARDKALEIVVHYVPGSEYFVYADPVRIRQVLGNLVNNAIKFTPKGYIIITVREEKDELLPPDKVNMIFSVEDTGIGIEEKDIERIFEKFSQANSSTTRDYGGTGLGLSISKKLIELMGGTISVNSTPGKGSAFHFRLPMTRNNEEFFIHPKPPVLHGVRVLIVDDLPVIRAMLCEQLSMAGMICDMATSGREALQKLVDAREAGQLYDIMIIDYLMPGMNGEMLARAINDEPDFRNICLIMLTAAGNPIVGDDFAEKGFSAYISKPVRALNLIDSLAVIWSKYKSGYTNSLIRVDTSSISAGQAEDLSLSLTGFHILLVEDSRLNQAFVEEVLSQLSCNVTTVSNGQEALDAVRKERFDLVLMDCQMPVMDGFESSRRMKAMKEQGIINKSLPIVALTANAMQGDRQRCLDAGMDDYITKPVRKKELKEKIYFWIKREEISVHDDESHHEDTAEAEKEIINQNLLAEARAILKDKFAYLLECYIDDVADYIKQIDTAVTNQDVGSIVLPAHTIKSTSKRMGAIYLSNIARDIELAAREAANGNNTGLWTGGKMMDDIREIHTAFEETRKTLTKN